MQNLRLEIERTVCSYKYFRMNSSFIAHSQIEGRLTCIKLYSALSGDIKCVGIGRVKAENPIVHYLQ